VTHEYTVLTGGSVIVSLGEPPATAIAWAGDTVIGLGGDDEMRGLSRGDSWFGDLDGAWVVPLGSGDAAWPVDGTLDVGGPADLAILASDPRDAGIETARANAIIAVVRGGVVTAGALPGTPGGRHHGHGRPDEPEVSRR
jgi:predicted amidohydrolase YtcJ